jgi:hypothetical protein
LGTLNQLQPQIVAAGICPRATATPLGKAQQSFGALFNHSGVGFWEIDFSTTNPGLDPTKVLLTVTMGDGGNGTAGNQYGVAVSSGPLYAISTYRSTDNVQADVDLHVKFELMPSQR